MASQTLDVEALQTKISRAGFVMSTSDAAERPWPKFSKRLLATIFVLLLLPFLTMKYISGAPAALLVPLAVLMALVAHSFGVFFFIKRRKLSSLLLAGSAAAQVGAVYLFLELATMDGITISESQGLVRGLGGLILWTVVLQLCAAATALGFDLEQPSGSSPVH